VYEVRIENPDGLECGVAELAVDGRKVKGQTAPVFEDGRVHEVRCRLGPDGTRGVR
jgi:hypothetical protein